MCQIIYISLLSFFFATILPYRCICINRSFRLYAKNNYLPYKKISSYAFSRDFQNKDPIPSNYSSVFGDVKKPISLSGYDSRDIPRNITGLSNTDYLERFLNTTQQTEIDERLKITHYIKSNGLLKHLENSDYSVMDKISMIKNNSFLFENSNYTIFSERLHPDISVSGLLDDWNFTMDDEE
tara:strand:+ start:2221 stop:2766 length:546 start_codon:yes stop_codon:yes gene_type:complete